MRVFRMVAAAFAVAFVTTSPAAAQHIKARPAAPASSGRVAGIAPAPQVIVVQPGFVQPGFVSPAIPFYGSVPVVVFPDGRVFANFGYGYEQVVTACGASPGVVVVQNFDQSVIQPSVVQPTIAQPSINTPMPYTPSVPAQQTESQRMLGQQARAVQNGQAYPISRGCWSRDTRGQVFVSPR